MISEKVYQSIYDELDKYLIAGWDKLIVYLEYGKASYSFSFYVKANGKYVKCYDLPEVSEDDIAASFKKIDKIVDKERKKNKDEWSNMTVIIEKTGKMHADLDYTDLSEGTYQFKKSWKKKYLV
ncbi:MAG: DUF600 family protein [Oribacterium sp.]|nr:DUF600 family protein [Oribacterium sp.]